MTAYPDTRLTDTGSEIKVEYYLSKRFPVTQLIKYENVVLRKGSDATDNNLGFLLISDRSKDSDINAERENERFNGSDRTSNYVDAIRIDVNHLFSDIPFDDVDSLMTSINEILLNVGSDTVEVPTISNGKKRVQLLINMSQSNGVLDRTADPDVGAGTTEANYFEFEKVLVSPANTITFTRSNTGGPWKENTYTKKLWFNPYRNTSATNAFGWIYGWEQHRKAHDGPQCVLIDASLGAQPVNYFHPGSGVRITAQGVGWAAAELKIREAYDLSKEWDYEIVSPHVYIHQGESGASWGVIDTAAKAADFVDDWIEILTAISVLCGNIVVTAQFNQIFHTTPATMTQRNLINAEFAARAAALPYIDYIELLSADDIANQDPNDLTQDEEHWDTKGAIRFGARASEFALANYDASRKVVVPELPAPAVQESRYYMHASGVATVQNIQGATSYSYLATAVAYITDAVEGKVVTMQTSKWLQTNMIHAYKHGFGLVIRCKIHTAYSPGYIFESGVAGIAMAATTTSAPHSVFTSTSNDGAKSIGVNHNDGVWRTLGITMKNGVLKLYVNGVIVYTGTVSSYTPDVMYLLGAKRATTQGARAYVKEVYAINRGDMTDADHLAKHNAMVAAFVP